MKRNPPWTRNEAILALELYVRSERTVLDKSRQECIRLAKEVNQARRVLDPEAPSAVRTGGSVAAKLANFRALDPTSPSVGFSNIAKVDLDVWKEFADQPARLFDVARLIRSAMTKR